VLQVGFIYKIPLCVSCTKYTRSFPHLNNKPKICHIHLTLKGEYNTFVLQLILFRFSVTFFFHSPAVPDTKHNLSPSQLSVTARCHIFKRTELFLTILNKTVGAHKFYCNSQILNFIKIPSVGVALSLTDRQTG